MNYRLIDIIMEQDGVLNPIEIKKTSNPGTELINVFSLLDKASVPRSKGAVLCMKPNLSAINKDNYIVPIWMIWHKVFVLEIAKKIFLIEVKLL